MRTLPTRLVFLIVMTIACAMVHAQTSKIDAILQTGGASAWKLSPATCEATEADGMAALIGPGGAAFTVESVAAHTGPTETVAKLLLRPAEGGTGYLTLRVGIAERGENPVKSMNCSASAVGGQAHVGYSATVQGGKTKALNGRLTFQAVTDRSLAWSEEMRGTIETQIANSPKVEETVLTLRCRIEADRFRSWLNGRLIGELALEPGTDPSGLVRIEASAGARLVSLRVEPAASDSRRFERVSIEDFANSATLAGVHLDRSSLPTGPVNGVPFEFVPAERANDHIDLGTSWARFGAIPGYIAANSGAFGGRWIAADRVDPSRHAMYVPQGRYKALHLIAVSEDRENSVPIVTAQFYRPNAGHPFNFAGIAPKLGGEAGEATAVPIKTADGKATHLYHVTIPLDQDAFSWFTDLTRIGMEITKQAHYYRAYPDPLEFSWHGGGLPSSVQIYAMTLERASVDVDIEPDAFGHVWTAPQSPSYTVHLRNNTGVPMTGKLTVSTESQDGKEKSVHEYPVSLPAESKPVDVSIPLSVKRYGLHHLKVECGTPGETATYKRDFAYLHEDTRERGDWAMGRGPLFGYWGWGGGHETPKAEQEIRVMAAAGAETSTANYSMAAPQIQELAIKHHFHSEGAFSGGIMYFNGFYSWYGGAPKFNPENPDESAAALIEAMKKQQATAGPLCTPTFVPFFAEPHMGPITVGVWPSHYGEDNYTLSEAEQKVFDDMRAKYLAGAGAIRKEWPEYKLLLPYGDPMNAVVFLKLSPESRSLIDGCALDLPGFERLPEQQVNQVVLNRLYPIMKDLRQYIENPYFVLIEGPCVSSKDIDTGQTEQAHIGIRDFLNLMGYGVYLFESGNAPFDCANYWGENHYGGGWCSRLPLAMPKLAYTHYATLSRHVNRCNFASYVPTGSTSTYCQEYTHYKSEKRVHVLWTIRGTRSVHVKVAGGATVNLYDSNDNVRVLEEKDGVVTFTVGQAPVYLEGLTATAQVTLGDSDHSDVAPTEMSTKLGNIGDGSWSIDPARDDEYEKNKAMQIERFPGSMTAQTVSAPAAQGEKAMAVHLEKQAKDRGVMPFYTTIRPASPVTIPGKASQVSLWVHAASDWGRLVYSVRDAKGEKWISVGTKDDWNNDDIHGWSAFCFDGWRYMQFQLPSNLPYDSYRERGSSWWGCYGGDGVVDLPLTLEKIIIERRPKAIYGNDLVETKPDDVLLGDLYADYADAANMGDAAVQLSRIRMPRPKDVPALTNPIADLAAAGVLAPATSLRVEDPTYQYDGTRCHVHFEKAEGATSYDVWVSPYEDGRGALHLGTGWTEPGQLITGLRPETTFYLFVTYTGAEDKPSKPSGGLAFSLKNRFGYK